MQPPDQPIEPAPQSPMSSDEKLWGMLCHLLALAGFVVPFGSIIGPLVAWLVKKEQYPFVNDQGKESLNFQITLLIAFIISGILSFVGIGIVLAVILAVIDVVYVIMASIAANEGRAYRYPFSFKFIK